MKNIGISAWLLNFAFFLTPLTCFSHVLSDVELGIGGESWILVILFSAPRHQSPADRNQAPVRFFSDRLPIEQS